METLFEHTILRGLLMNRPEALQEADAIARQHQFTEEMLTRCQHNILKWLRHHSVTPLHIEELSAITKIQSIVRSWLVRKRLYIKFTMLMNLVKSGSTSHLYEAKVYESMLNMKRR